MTLKPCLVCGALGTTSRCPTHTRPGRTKAEQTRRATSVALHIATHGPVCPGYGRSPHPSGDLTADHRAPWATTGTEHGPLDTLCRGCNARRGNRG